MRDDHPADTAGVGVDVGIVAAGRNEMNAIPGECAGEPPGYITACSTGNVSP
jgi:hypothetical protein